MVDLTFLGIWEKSIRHVKENLQDPFGGLVAVLMFDHCQLRTVKGAPLYKTSCGAKPLSSSQNRGRVLYRNISKVIYLTENMQFLRDPEWGQWLESARLGNWTQDFQGFIRTLPDFDRRPPQPHRGLIQTISTENMSRTTINRTAIELAIHSLPAERKVYVVPARLSRQLSQSEQALIREMPDNKTGNIPLFLHLYVGMPVRVKSNQCMTKGVVNGAFGHVHHIDWPRNATFAIQPNGTWFASTEPNNIYVDIENCKSAVRFELTPPHWPSSVMPVFQVTASVSLPGPSLSIKGFPLVPAFGTTVHGVQGETRGAVAVTDLRPPTMNRVDPHSLYVALSRLRTRCGLHWLGRRPSSQDYAFFRPSPEVLLEDTRLRRLSDTTLDKFHEVGQSLLL